MQQFVTPEVIGLIKQDAAERSDVPAQRWVVVEQTSMDWTDTSLGVREPGKMYGRVMIPGHRIVVRDGRNGNREMVYHTAYSGAFVFSHAAARGVDGTPGREVA